ncbi:MAG: hypothetical protein HC814_06335, partial [Rhodobacteraceae bacterium]|nr:hypothetical protein [Paracoccaceae bacterium]
MGFLKLPGIPLQEHAASYALSSQLLRQYVEGGRKYQASSESEALVEAVKVARAETTLLRPNAIEWEDFWETWPKQENVRLAKLSR